MNPKNFEYYWKATFFGRVRLRPNRNRRASFDLRGFAHEPGVNPEVIPACKRVWVLSRLSPKYQVFCRGAAADFFKSVRAGPAVEAPISESYRSIRNPEADAFGQATNDLPRRWFGVYRTVIRFIW
jgi:hypothetical protein